MVSVRYSWCELFVDAPDDVRACEEVTYGGAVQFLHELIRVLADAGFRSVADRDFPDDLS